jgi:glutamine amidotransferase
MNRKKIGIIDYNMGNLASVQNALLKLNADSQVESDPEKIKQYDSIVLPGVGAFGDAIDALKSRNLDKAILEYSNTGKNILGICLGLQLLFEKSEEFGNHEGLGLIEGSVQKFDIKNKQLKVPHMGWNKIFTDQNNPIFNKMPKDFYLYFVHSFHVATDSKYQIGQTHYEYNFTSAVNKNNIFGLQPHPEKSHSNGLQILENFINL